MPVAVTAPGVERDAVLHALSASDDPIRRLLQKAGARRGWWPAGRRWQRSYARFDETAAPRCILMYETIGEPQQLCVVELHDARPDADEPAQIALADAALGWMRIERFPSDPCLPTLAEIIERAGAARIVRYRPRRRCTLRLRGEANANAPWAKVFADERGERIHRESISLHDAARAGALGFHVARPGAWDARLRLLTQGHVAGAPVIDTLHGPHGRELASRMGAACATLAVSPLRPSELHDGETQLARSTRYAAELCRRIPALADDVAHLLAQLRALHRAAAPGRLRPIHGAPHAHQWLDGPAGLGLVDFDRHCFGDPELDVATFVAETDFEDRARVDVDALNRAFVDAYEDVAGPLDPALLAAYRSHKRLAKALKASRAPRADAAAKATRNLRRALRCLKEMS